MTAACDWCIGRLRSGGVPVGPRIGAYRAGLAAESTVGPRVRQ